MKFVKEDGIEYYTIDNIEKIQNEMFEQLLVLDEVCKKNNLIYYLDGGTAIGALRHKGFIPWDDDLDITMLKPDYLKLIELLKSLPDEFYLFDPNLDSHCCAFFGRKCDYVSSENGFRYKLYPIKVDIRPINVIENTEEAKKENRIFRNIANKIIFGKCDSELEKEAMFVYEHSFDGNKRKFLEYYNKEYGLYSDYENALFVHPYLEYSNNTFYKYEEVVPYDSVKFCNRDFFIMKNDCMLTEVYSNYMDLPSLEARKPEANCVYYVNNKKPIFDYLLDRRNKSVFEKICFVIKAIAFTRKM